MNDPYDNHKHQSSVHTTEKLFSRDSFIQRLVGIIIVIKSSIGIEKISTNDLDRCNFIVGYAMY